MSRNNDPENNAPFWHQSALTPAMGCHQCADFQLCGGLAINRSIISCADLCDCSEPKKCDIPCIRNTRVLVGRSLEVKGWDLNNIPRTQTITCSGLPPKIPILFQKNRRTDRLSAPAVAIRLRDLFSEKTGALKFKNREALAERFLFDSAAKLVIIGVSEDTPIELYWEKARKNGFPNVLKYLEPSLITAPNFSMFNNTVRWPDFHSMKRIALCWWEMVEAGLPTSLHVHGRTETDYERWAEFAQRQEVQSVSFEFATGAASPARAPWHVAQLAKIGQRTGGRLSLIIKGGWRFKNQLAPQFREIIFLDSNPFMKAVSRKILGSKKGRPHWKSALTLQGQGIDGILQYNVDASL